MIGKIEEMINELCERVTSLLKEVYRHYLSFQLQLNEENAAFIQLQKKPDWKKPKDFQPPTQPGAESVYRRRQQYDK